MQQYVSSYGGPYFPSAPIYGYEVFGPNPWMSSPPHPPLPPPIVDHRPIEEIVESNSDYHDDAPPPSFSIIPETPGPSSSLQPSPQPLASNESTINTLRQLLPWPFEIINIFNRVGAFMLTLLGIVIFGGSILSSICAFIPICTFDFPLILGKSIVVEQQPARVNIESLNRTEKALQLATDKYD